MNTTALALVTLSLLGACTDLEHELEDARDATFADGKADGFEIREGSPEAVGVLALANEASASSLRTVVGLSTRAANAIVAARKGEDGALLTDDDQILWSLEELDALPYVGITALEKLSAFASAEGYVTERRRAMFYSYGIEVQRSRLYLLDDGTGYAEDEVRGDTGFIRRGAVNDVPASAVAELHALIEEAKDGELQHDEQTGTSWESYPTGSFVVYTEAGEPVTIEHQELTTSGSTVTHERTWNTSAAADELRQIAYDLTESAVER